MYIINYMYKLTDFCHPFNKIRCLKFFSYKYANRLTIRFSMMSWGNEFYKSDFGK